MLHAIMLAALVSGVADGLDSKGSAPVVASVEQREPVVQLRFGGVEFTANRIAASDSRASESNPPEVSKATATLALESARCSIGDGDIVIVADKMLVDVEGAQLRSIAGVGNCGYVSEEENGLRAVGDRLHFTDEGLSLEGKVKLICSNGTAVTAESVRIRGDGSGGTKLVLSGTSTLTLEE